MEHPWPWVTMLYTSATVNDLDELGLMARVSSRVPEMTVLSPRGVPSEKRTGVFNVMGTKN